MAHDIQREDLSVLDNEVIGVFAFNERTAGVFCNEEACIIAGSKGKIKKYVGEAPGIDHNSVPKIRKTTYGEIKKGLSMGGVYDFDEESFERFKQIAAKDGLSFHDFGQDKRNNGRGIKLFRVALL